MSKKVVICASVKKEEEILKWKKKLEDNNFEVIKYPRKIAGDDFLTTYSRKFKSHYEAISKTDSILALNYDQNGISGYLGAGTFAEMAFALGLNKDIEVFYSHHLPKKEEFPYMDEVRWWNKLGWIKKINL